jgi:hypothetical protein
MENTISNLNFKRIDPYHSVGYLTEGCLNNMSSFKKLGELVNTGSVSAGYANPQGSNNLSTFVYENDKFTYVVNEINSYDHTVVMGVRYDKVVTEV